MAFLWTLRVSSVCLGFSVDLLPTVVQLNKGLKRTFLWEEISPSNTCLSTWQIFFLVGSCPFFGGEVPGEGEIGALLREDERFLDLPGECFL